MITVSPATAEHCIQLAPNLREMDKLECEAIAPGIPNEVRLVLSIEMSSKAYAVIDDVYGCVAIFGIRDLMTRGTGIPWMLASDKFFERNTKKFIKECKEHFAHLIEGFDYLYNVIAIQNTKCQRWLKWIGFTVDLKSPIDINGVTFCPFYYKEDKPCVVS